VLSGPGHCTKSRHRHRRRNASSLVHISHHSDSDSAAAAAAAAAADRSKGILVQLNLPHQLPSTSNVHSSCCACNVYWLKLFAVSLL